MITVYVCADRMQTAVSPIKKEGASENLINLWSFKMSDFMGSFWIYLSDNFSHIMSNFHHTLDTNMFQFIVNILCNEIIDVFLV